MASARQRNGKWYYRITITVGDGSHKYIERGSWKTKREAINAGNELEESLKYGKLPARQSNISFDFLSKEWMEWSVIVYKLSTIQGYKKDLKTTINRTRTRMASKPFYGISHTSYQNSDLVGNTAVLRASISKSMHEIESIATEAGGDIAEWIFLSVTQGKSYTILQAYGIPCSKEYFYKRYRKFFYLLSQNRE